ncbi:MAG: phage baseplate assembly protein V [Pseudanabaenales cyanobacterium]|nr:phage baseplate assembly protein V [Pseudanabaenales cyanobacterium]
MTYPPYYLQSEEKGSGALSRGVVVATVTNVSEIANGRVKVKYSWREKENGQNDEMLAGVITSEKGTQPSLAVDDRVLMAFTQDGFEYPYIIGFIWPQPAGE